MYLVDTQDGRDEGRGPGPLGEQRGRDHGEVDVTASVEKRIEEMSIVVNMSSER